MQVAFAHLLQQRFNNNANAKAGASSRQAHAFTPGYTFSPILDSVQARWYADLPWWLLKAGAGLRTPVEVGAATGLWIATSEDRNVASEGAGGAYWDRCVRRTTRWRGCGRFGRLMLGQIGRRFCGGRCFCYFYWQGWSRRCPELITCLISWIEKLFHLSHCEANRTKKRSRNSVLAGISSLSLSSSSLHYTWSAKPKLRPKQEMPFQSKKETIHPYARYASPLPFFRIPYFVQKPQIIA